MAAAADDLTGDPVVVAVTDRPPLALLAHFPRRAEVAGVNYSELLRRMSDEVEKSTALRVEEVLANPVDRCVSPGDGTRRMGLIACLTMAVFPAYAPGGESYAGLTVESVWERLERRARLPRHAVFVTASQDDTRGLLSALLIDTRAALAQIHSFMLRRSNPSALDYQRLEDDLTDAVVRGARAAVRRPTDVEVYFEHLFAFEFRAALQRTGSLARYGAIELIGEEAGEVFLDGDRVAETSGGRLRLVRIPPGRHTIRVHRPGAFRFEQDVWVEADRTALAPYTLVREGPIRKARFALTTGGVLTIAGGLTLVTIGIVRGMARSDARYDVVPEGQPGFGADFDRWGPVPIAPLGYGFVGLGAGSLLGVLLTGDDEMPWGWLLGGALVGVAAFGVSLAVDSALGPNRDL